MSEKKPGLIPARAGNTVSSLCLRANSGAHPRSRGEHLENVLLVALAVGSSPLARGTLKVRKVEDPEGGLIPARAGNTYSDYSLKARNGAHPRSRGEH